MRGVVRMGVVEAHNLHSALTRITLYAHQFGRINFEPFVRFVDSNVLTRLDAVHVRFAGTELSQEHSATFFGVGFLGMLPHSFEVRLGNKEAQLKSGAEALTYFRRDRHWPEGQHYPKAGFRADSDSSPFIVSRLPISGQCATVRVHKAGNHPAGQRCRVHRISKHRQHPHSATERDIQQSWLRH